MSLYGRLYKYRERRERRPLEDFLTEALADLINRLPEHLARRFAERLLGDRIEATANLNEVWRSGTRAKWVTQRPIYGGRIADLTLEIDGVPIILVENKISAGFQEHISFDESTGKTSRRHQLASYGQWISRESDKCWNGALVLLTHWTPPPADFLGDDSTYGCSYRTTVRWSELARWLAAVIRAEGVHAADWAQLGIEFLDFLKEHHMDSELATQQDLAALQVYISAADRVRNTVEQIWESGKDIWRPICQQANRELEISTQYGCVWKYRYFQRLDLRSCYVAAGIRYPGVGEYPRGLTVTSGPYFFVELGADDEGSPVSDMQLPEIWFSGADLRLAMISLRNLPIESEEFLLQASQWLRDRMSEVAKVAS